MRLSADWCPGSAPRDLAWVAVGVVLFAALSVHFELSEKLLAWTTPRESLQLDELPDVLLVLACSLLWFAWRRMREVRVELRRRLVAESELRNALLANRRLARANVELQEAERRSLARELHDELGQCLNAIKLDAVAIGAGRAQRSGAREAARSIVALVDHLEGVVRDMLRRLRPPGLDDLGLGAALTHCVDGWRNRMPDVRFDMRVSMEEEHDYGEAVNIALYRLVQEGLTNIARHARPDRVSIALVRRATANATDVILTMRNDGAGFGTSSPPGLGLLGMRERIDALGGTLAVRGGAHGEFRLEARVPVSGRSAG